MNKDSLPSADEADAQGHIWWMWHGMNCCKKCGILKRKEGVNKPCHGIVKVSLR